MSPSVADELDSLRRAGQLSTGAAAVSGIDVAGDRLRVRLGTDDTEGGGPELVDADWVVSCTGAQDDVTAVRLSSTTRAARTSRCEHHEVGVAVVTRSSAGVNPVLCLLERRFLGRRACGDEDVG